eukprot:9269910-Lingulodinium_polyedra.AAC.1
MVTAPASTLGPLVKAPPGRGSAAAAAAPASALGPPVKAPLGLWPPAMPPARSAGGRASARGNANGARRPSVP